MKLFRVLGLLLLFISFQLSAQKSYLDEADHALYKEQKYYEAIEMYKKAYVKEKERDVKAQIIYRIAEAYRLSDQAEQAEVWYDKAIIARYAEPEAQLHLGNMKMQLGKYDEALVAFQKYAAENPNDKRGKLGMDAAEKVQKWADKPENFVVEPNVLINSEFYDYGAKYADKKNDQIYFTSTREGSTGADISSVIGEYFSDIYWSKQDKKGKWSEPVLVEGVNTEASEGAPVMNAKRNTMYFTRCMVEKEGYIGCHIMSAKKQGNKFAEPIEVQLGSDSAHIGHPALTPDDKTIIFAADFEGGQGGKDLYYVTEINRGEWSKPINLGPEINTKGNEMFPFVHANGDLYFSSNGHLGMGGLDNFVAPKKGDNQWGNTKNLKAPINSSANDFAIMFDGEEKRGMFSSSREGGRGKDDIWTFYSPEPVYKLETFLKDLESGEPLSAATVKLIGTDGTTVEKETDAEGKAEFDLSKNTSYSITASKVQYLNAKGKETTVGHEESKIFRHLYELQPVKDAPIKLPEILYAFNSIELTEQAKDSLEFLYQTLIDNPTLVIELRANTDSRGSDKYNLKLSQGRAESAVTYLVSRGIPVDRMVPKGYGESNLLIADGQINQMATEEEREAAHQLNRRTEFSVLSFDYVPKQDEPAEEDTGSEDAPAEGEETEN